MFAKILISALLLIIYPFAIANGDTQKNESFDSVSEITGGDFLLHSSQGELSPKQLRGKVVLLYFGYTKCPDICPTSLSIIAQTLNGLSERELESVQAVFISVDPKRDSLEILDNYARYFHPKLIGATGSEQEIAEMAKRYGVKYEEVALDGSSFGYSVNHSATTYLITPDGELRYLFPHETPSFVILEAIRYLLGSQ